jgi:hypothetical protein
MIFTLDIGGRSQVTDPSAETIHSAAMGLNTKNTGCFLILTSSDGRSVQTFGGAQAGFDLEYSDHEKRVFRARRDFTAEEIVRIFLAHMRGDTTWKTGIEWEPIDG